jgi:hypothetical protein
VTGKFIDDKISDFTATFSELKRFLTDRSVLEIESNIYDLRVVTWRILERVQDIGASLRSS